MESKIRVLPVDDNPSIQKLLRDYLGQKDDIELTGVALDGEQALLMAEKTRPDIILLDIIMPRLDGFAVLQALSAQDSPPKVIVMTALSRDDFVARAMGMGACYYMVKPVDPEVLYSRIHEVYALLDTPVFNEAQRPVHTPDEEVTNLFLTIGIPAHIKGYQYLREAVKMVLEDHDVINRITKELYPGIARRFGTTSSKVERAMRHAIEVAWNRGRLDSINRLYGFRVFSPEDKPTNGEFIAMVADKVSTQKSA